MKGRDYILERVRQNPLAAPMHVALYDRARSIGESLADFAGQETADAARSLVRKLGEAKLLEHLEGRIRLGALVCIREALSYVHGLLDLMFAMQGLGSYAITLGGSDAQKARYAGGAARGEKIAAFALTEPEAGSDLGAVATAAARQGDDYVVNGTKVFISNGDIADFFTVLARTGPETGSKGLTMFVVERTDPGFEVARAQQVVAYHPIAELRFRDCRIPVSRRVGQEGEGFKLALAVLETFRTSVAGAALGMAERALAEAIDHVQARRQFGKPLAEQPAVQARLADMAIDVETSRLAVYRSAARRDSGTDRIPLESSAAKIVATEAAQRVVDSAVQLLGGRGVEKGSATERLYREIRALRIYEGATEVLKQVLAAQLLR